MYIFGLKMTPPLEPFWNLIRFVILWWSEWYWGDQSDIALVRVILWWSFTDLLRKWWFFVTDRQDKQTPFIIYLNHHHLYHIAQRLKLTLSNTISVSEGLTSHPPHSHPATKGGEEDFLFWDSVWEEKWKLCKLILRFCLQIQGRSEAGWVGNMKVFLLRQHYCAICPLLSYKTI